MNEYKKNNRIQRTAIALAITSALSSTAVMAAEENTAGEEVEVIEVRGIANSIAESARQKRFDSRIVDAIVAEDIGKLPDNNIAEALQRITGVSIKSDFGVGESVTIRGISDNRVELNGRSTSGTTRGGISLDDFPSSFLKTIEVVKTPTPDMIEGALGGTVNMKTVRPLELKETLVAVTLDYEYADKTENYAPKMTAAIGSNWDLGDMGSFGASAVFSYLDREVRQDEFQTKMNALSSIAGTDLVGNGPNDKFMVRTENTVRVKAEERERTAYGLSLQWAPESGAGNIYLDLSGAELEGGQNAYDYLDVAGTVTANDDTYQTSSGELKNYDLVGAFVIPKTESDFSENDSVSHALGGEWQLTDKLQISGEIAYTSSEEDEVLSQLNLRPVDRAALDEALLTDPNADPGSYMNKFTATVGLGSGEVSSVEYSQMDALTNPDTMVIREMYYDTSETDNEEVAIRFDVEYSEPMGIEWISAVKAGVRFTETEYEYQTRQLRNNDGNTFKDAYKKAQVLDDDGNATDEHLYPTFLNEFNEQYGGIIPVRHENLFDQAGKAGANDLTEGVNVYDADLLRNDAEGTFAIFQDMMEGTTYATTGSLHDNMYDRDSEYKLVEEETRALYLQFHLDFDEITAIVGGRYVETDLDSTIKDDSEADGELTGENDYDDFLPSLNVTYNYSEDTLVRFAAAKVMRRADYNDLSPSFDINDTLVNGSQGSYELDPYRVTQYDLSVEHYFGKGGLISAAYFYKDVESFTKEDNSCLADPATINGQQVGDEWANVCILDEQGVSQGDVNTLSPDDYSNELGTIAVEALSANGFTGIDVSSDVNGGSGEVQGFELAYQQQFDFLPGAWSGLGVSTNYTYADSEQPNGLPLENISQHTANAQVYWEGAGFQVRVAYNWRDRFLDEENEGKRVTSGGVKGYGSDADRTDVESATYDPTAGNSYREARGQLDFSSSYDFNDNLTIVANITNVTGEPVQYTTAQEHDWKLNEADRRYTIGLRAKF